MTSDVTRNGAKKLFTITKSLIIYKNQTCGGFFRLFGKLSAEKQSEHGGGTIRQASIHG